MVQYGSAKNGVAEMKKSANVLREEMARAIARRNVGALQACLQSGADPDWRIGGSALERLVRGGEPVRTALHWVLAQRDAALARIFVEAGATVREGDLLAEGLK